MDHELGNLESVTRNREKKKKETKVQVWLYQRIISGEVSPACSALYLTEDPTCQVVLFFLPPLLLLLLLRLFFCPFLYYFFFCSFFTSILEFRLLTGYIRYVWLISYRPQY